MQIKLSVSAAVEGFYYVFGSVKRVHAKGKKSKGPTELKTRCFGHEYSLKAAKPIFNQAGKTLKKRVQSGGHQSDLVALIFVNR